VSSRAALSAFNRAQASGSAEQDPGAKALNGDEAVDVSLWSAKRVREYQASLAIEKRLPMAVLSIGKLRIRVPVVELTTPGERSTYVVDQLEIVSPERVEVLRPRGVPSLTLVTCYPFYFVGDAPQRFIVHAARQGQRLQDQPEH
jgi:sortase A